LDLGNNCSCKRADYFHIHGQKEAKNDRHEMHVFAGRLPEGSNIDSVTSVALSETTMFLDGDSANIPPELREYNKIHLAPGIEPDGMPTDYHRQVVGEIEKMIKRPELTPSK